MTAMTQSTGKKVGQAVLQQFTSTASVSSEQHDHKQALLYCSLLALQFGLQPMIAAKFTPSGVSKSSVVIATEVFKIVIAALSLLLTASSTELEKLREQWSLTNSLQVAALPAMLYAIQNLFVQYGYVLMDSMTFNLLNQTKTLSAAFWLFLLIGQKQSPVQILALMLLLVAAVMLNVGGGGSTSAALQDGGGYSLGLTMVAAASILSGLSSALTQRALMGTQARSPVFLSAELAVYGIVFLLANLFVNSDIQGDGLFSNWQWYSLIPVITNAFGGIVVGQVTKYAGGVVKGFALIAGIVITGIAQWIVDGKPLGAKDGLAVLLVSVSIYLHAKFPPAKDGPNATTSSKAGSKAKKDL